MRVAALDIIEYRAPFAQQAGNGVTLWHERRAVLIKMTTDAGVCGLGEAWAPANAVEPVLAHLATIAPRLVGCAIAEVVDAAAVVQSSTSWVDAATQSALDLASIDAMARAAGQPLWQFGGGQPQIQVYASGGLYAQGKDPAALAAGMASYVRAGFTSVKMKVGALALPEDLARIAAVRAAIGDGVLIVDALGRLDPSRAAATIERYANAGATAVQAPLPLDQLDDIAELAITSCLKLWIGEDGFDVDAFDRLAALARPPLIQLNPALVGGTRAARLAQRFVSRTPTTLQCHATAVLQAACLHLAGWGCGIAHAEFHLFHRHLHELLPACFPLQQAAQGPIDELHALVPSVGARDRQTTLRRLAVLGDGVGDPIQPRLIRVADRNHVAEWPDRGHVAADDGGTGGEVFVQLERIDIPPPAVAIDAVHHRVDVDMCAIRGKLPVRLGAEEVDIRVRKTALQGRARFRTQTLDRPSLADEDPMPIGPRGRHAVDEREIDLVVQAPDIGDSWSRDCGEIHRTWRQPAGMEAFGIAAVGQQHRLADRLGTQGVDDPRRDGEDAIGTRDQRRALRRFGCRPSVHRGCIVVRVEYHFAWWQSRQIRQEAVAEDIGDQWTRLATADALLEAAGKAIEQMQVEARPEIGLSFDAASLPNDDAIELKRPRQPRRADPRRLADIPA